MSPIPSSKWVQAQTQIQQANGLKSILKRQMDRNLSLPRKMIPSPSPSPSPTSKWTQAYLKSMKILYKQRHSHSSWGSWVEERIESLKNLRFKLLQALNSNFYKLLSRASSYERLKAWKIKHSYYNILKTKDQDVRRQTL